MGHIETQFAAYWVCCYVCLFSHDWPCIPVSSSLVALCHVLQSSLVDENDDDDDGGEDEDEDEEEDEGMSWEELEEEAKR